jgi:predicted porin
LQNAYIGATYQPINKLTLNAGYHYLATATKLDDMNMLLGHEVELDARYALSSDVKVSAGFSFMKGSDTMERLKRSSRNNQLRWGWLSVSVNPRIFSTKW